MVRSIERKEKFFLVLFIRVDFLCVVFREFFYLDYKGWNFLYLVIMVF